MGEDRQIDAFRSGFATIVGRPNVGKSTLMNYLIGQKIAITSNKPQTTRNRIMSVYTEAERGQIVFVDTPGIIQAKNKLGEYMVRVTRSAVQGVDILLWLVEPDEEPGPADRRIAEQLKKAAIPVILVINKIDTKPKEALLPVIDHFKDLMDFCDIVPICARDGDGTDILLEVIFSCLPEGPMYFDEDTVTDQPERAL
ncbi:MAG: GTPase Era, partial [Lachnospiraceae bacterium]|nr:GTPase Era [Lachnospiraceae bacterium]